MCEYCGCRALATIDELSREHDLVAGLISDVRAAFADADIPRMAELARQIAIVLGRPPGPYRHLKAGYWRVEAVFGEALSGAPADPAWPARLAETLQMLREHVLKEQEGVFPAALACPGIADWEAVEAGPRPGRVPAGQH